jgi:spermidine/putrescine-binding protein
MANARVVGTIEAIGIPSVRHECGTVTGRRLTRGIRLSIVILVLVLSVTTQATEDVLRLLIWEGYGPEEYVQSFEKKMEKKYGRKVKLDFSLAKGSDDFFAAIRNRTVDVVTISHHTIKDERFNFIAKRLIMPFNLKNIPNHAHVIPNIKMADFHVTDGKVYGVPVASGPYGLAYNTAKIKHAPQSWNIFWDPAYEKQYVIGAHEYMYNVNITAMAMGYPRESIGSYDALNTMAFRNKLRQLALGASSVWVGVDKPEDLLGMSFATSWGDSLSALEKQGEVWQMAEPAEGTMWWIDEYAFTWTLAGKPFLKKVAEEWVNESLSADFQVNHLVRQVGIYPVVTNIASRLTDTEMKRLQIGVVLGGAAEKRILQRISSKRDRNGLKLLWKEAMKGIPVNRASDE